jgi:hypothetical protein
LFVEDLAAAQALYEDIFGLSVRQNPVAAMIGPFNLKPIEPKDGAPGLSGTTNPSANATHPLVPCAVVKMEVAGFVGVAVPNVPARADATA